MKEFNKKYKVGKSVSFTENGKTIVADLRWPAEKLQDSEREVIWVQGRLDAVDFKNVII